MLSSRNAFQKERRDPGTMNCECGCHARNMCNRCPLNDVAKLIAKVVELFGD